MRRDIRHDDAQRLNRCEIPSSPRVSQAGSPATQSTARFSESRFKASMDRAREGEMFPFESEKEVMTGTAGKAGKASPAWAGAKQKNTGKQKYARIMKYSHGLDHGVVRPRSDKLKLYQERIKRRCARDQIATASVAAATGRR